MASSSKILLLSLSLLIAVSPSFQKPHLPNTLLLPVWRDPKTSQYIVQVKQRTPLVPVNLTLDLGGPHLWVDCDPDSYQSTSYRPAHCNSSTCKLASGFICHDCPPNPSVTKQRPGCNLNTCMRDVAGPTTVSLGEVTTDVLSLRSTNGKNPGPFVSVPDFIFTCGSGNTVRGLANGVKGMAGLGRTPTSMPSQLSKAFGFRNKVSVCLSENSTGVVLFGEGPFYFLQSDPSSPAVLISQLLDYTRLIRYPIYYYREHLSPEYYIGVNAVRFNNDELVFNKSILTLDKSGRGGTKISTTEPYMILHSSIYRSLINYFGPLYNPIASIVPPVKPFGLCFNASEILPARTGPGVPLLELVLENQYRKWPIMGANLMVDAGNGALCLAAVDGGKNAKTAIVIGQHTIADNFLEFDLAKSRLGFTSSLLLEFSGCSYFNFTSSG